MSGKVERTFVRGHDTGYGYREPHFRKRRAPDPTIGVYVQNRIAIGFDDETFAAVQALANHDGVSFAEAARQLIRRALTDTKAVA